MKIASDLYTYERTGAGPNDFRLVPQRPIQTRDAASTRSRGPSLPLFKPNDAVRLATERERGQTRDEILESMNSGKTIGLGTVWDGTGVNSRLDEKVAPVRDFVSGFIPGNVVGAEGPGTVIDLGRVYLPRVTDEELRAAMGKTIDEAEEEWKKDKRSTDDDACDVPADHTKDGAPRSRLFGGGKATPASEYAAGLKKGRETQDLTPPPKVATAKDYAATLAAGRRGKTG